MPHSGWPQRRASLPCLRPLSGSSQMWVVCCPTRLSRSSSDVHLPGGHFLSRLPGELGMYLALSGARLKVSAPCCNRSALLPHTVVVQAADLMYTRVATHYVPSERIEDLKVASTQSTPRPAAYALPLPRTG